MQSTASMPQAAMSPPTSPTSHVPLAPAILESTSVRQYLDARRARRSHAGAGHHAAEPPVPSVVVIEHSATAVEALATFAKHGILAAPLVIVDDGLEESLDLQDPSAPPYQMLRWLSIGDVVRTLVDLERRMQRESSDGDDPMHEQHSSHFVGTTLERMALLNRLAPRFEDTKAIQIDNRLPYGADGEMSYSGNTHDLSLAAVCRSVLVPPIGPGAHSPHHRIGIFDSTGVITDVLSQSDIVDLLLDHVAELGALAGATVVELGMCAERPPNGAGGTDPPFPHVLCVAASKPAIDCFAVLEDFSLSSAAIVDDATGVLVGCVSESDLRGLQAAHYGALALPIAEFLCLKHDLASVTCSRDNGGAAGSVDTEAPIIHWSASNNKIEAIEGQYAKLLASTLPPVCLVSEPSPTLGAVLRVLGSPHRRGTHRNHRRVHRVFIVDAPSGRPIACVSITDVLRAIVPTTNTPA